MDSIITADGVVVEVGTIVFDYYNMRIARIVTGPDDQGWFNLYELGKPGEDISTGQRKWYGELLNGERICSLSYAKKHEWYSKYVTDDEVALAEATLKKVWA